MRWWLRYVSIKTHYGATEATESHVMFSKRHFGPLQATVEPLRATTICDEYESHATVTRCGADRQSSERRHSQAGPDPVLQIDSSGKRQITGKADRQSPRGRRGSHLSGSSCYRPGNRNCSGEEEMCGKPMEAHLERQTKGQESQPSVQDELGGAETHDDGHPPVQICGHTAEGASTAQVNATCKNLKMGTVMGKTQACAISTVAWFSVKIECRRLLPESSKSASGSRCGGASMSTQGAEFVRSGGKKALILARDPRRWNQAAAGWKPSTPGFWQAPDASATVDGASFNKAQIIDSFSSDMDMQTWKRAAGHSLSAGMEKGIITDFAKKARSQLIRERKMFMAALGWIFLFVEPSTNPACLRVVVFPIIFSVCVATREVWQPGSTNCGNVPAIA